MCSAHVLFARNLGLLSAGTMQDTTTRIWMAQLRLHFLFLHVLAFPLMKTVRQNSVKYWWWVSTSTKAQMKVTATNPRLFIIRRAAVVVVVVFG